MKNRFFDTEAWKWILILLELLAIGAFILFIAFLFQGVASAEREGQQVWVLCNPDSYVTLRDKPKKASEGFGGVMCGGDMLTDGKVRNGYLHVFDLSSEKDSGWISNRYVVYSEPEEVNARMKVDADGRVALRKWIGGKIIGWLHRGDVLNVLWMCDEWAVTTRGYVMSEFLVYAESVEE